MRWWKYILFLSLVALVWARKPVFYTHLELGIDYSLPGEERGLSFVRAELDRNISRPFGMGALAGYDNSTDSGGFLGGGKVFWSPVKTKRFRFYFPVDFGVFVPLRESDGKLTPFAAGGAEARFFLTPSVFLSAGGRFSSLKRFSGVSFSVGWRFGFADRDRDWVDDEFDQCPGTPRGTVVDENGCALDSDADGVFDGYDRCPNTPLAAIVDSLGCPRDSDGDGVFDGVDRCDGTPNDIPVDSTGCPRDSDHDGVPDYVDSCANTPEGAIVDLKGCPRDSDEDGVPDGIDQCEKTPTGFEVDRFGCPTIPTADGMVVYDLFTDNLELTASAMNALYRAAKRIRAYPDRKTKILVYTDTEGSPAYNKNRARRVGAKIVEFLKEQGVSPDLLEIVPMGEADPLMQGLSPEAKRKNRRAKFVVEEPEVSR